MHERDPNNPFQGPVGDRWIRQPVIVVAHDPRWALLFAEERERLLTEADDLLEGIEHFGSTAVPGLKAKPIIDIIAIMRRPLDETDLARLVALGYTQRRETRVENFHFLGKGEPRTFHLQIGFDSPDRRKKLVLRDYLRAHPEETREYAALKAQLAAQFPDNPSQYTRSKAALLEALTARALDLCSIGGG